MSKPARRRVLLGGVGLSALGCRPAPAALSGEFVGANIERGHRLREPAAPQANDRSAIASPRRTTVAIVGGGIAGLSAARALRQAGIDDYQLFELDSDIGGNSRAGQIAGMACPWGAHYLPVPNLTSKRPIDRQLVALLREFGLIREKGAQLEVAEQALVHAPQERLLINGQWQTGLLPVDGASAATLAQYQQFAELIDAQRRIGDYHVGQRLEQAGGLDDNQRALDRISFSQWLDQQRLNDAKLRWYLDYCCRDDYGAASAEVSAWAGVHYFASRHGFTAPSSSAQDLAPELLTWPQGNAWLVQRMAAGQLDRIHRNAMVDAIEYSPGGSVALQVWHAREQRREQWRADFVVLAVPLNVAARILKPLPAALRDLLPRLRYSAWQVANVHLRELPAELPGAPLSWDNVVFGRDWLGYVDATHQLLLSHRDQTVWTSYRPLGTGIAARRELLSRGWREQARQVRDELSVAYVGIDSHIQRVDVVRWGHAMIAPVPGLRSDPALAQLADFDARVHLAHSDLAGYSVFEEAFAAGVAAAEKVAKRLKA